MGSILLDPSIRDWVLIPIVLIVVIVGVLRHYVTLLMSTKPKIVLSSVRNQNVSSYGGQLISFGSFLTEASFKERAQLLMREDLKREAEDENPMDMTDPSVMTGMMKNQFMGIINNFGLMMLISFFFSGFVVAKFPFGVPMRLKEMMQRGIDIEDLECSYVTSVSFYFLALYGTNGVLQLLLGSDAEVSMMNGLEQGGGIKQPVNYKKVYQQISEELKFCVSSHTWGIEKAPATLLKEWKSGKRKAARSASTVESKKKK